MAKKRKKKKKPKLSQNQTTVVKADYENTAADDYLDWLSDQW
jgi:hypothetical protein